MRWLILLLLVLPVFAEELEIYTVVTGKVVKVHVREGDKVKKGQLLLEIDPSLYRAELRTLMGRKREVEARLWKVERDYRRLKELFERDLLAETRLEDQKVKYEALRAQIEQIEGEIERVRTLISYTKILSPVDGRVKRVLAPEGSYVNGTLNPQPVLLISR